MFNVKLLTFRKNFFPVNKNILLYKFSWKSLINKVRAKVSLYGELVPTIKYYKWSMK